MEEYTLKIAAHSADLKTAPTASKDTGIFVPKDLMVFIGQKENYSFTIYKEDCVRALASIISSLPLYSNRGGRIIEHSSVYEECSSLFSMIANFFDGADTATYGGFQLSVIGDRRYLFGLEQRGFSIRKLLLANYSTITFQKDDDGAIILRFDTAIVKNGDNQVVIDNGKGKDVKTSNCNLFVTALRTKPFMLLAGISGTGKSRIVRKLAQATVTEELQKEYDPEYSGTDFQNDRWNFHKPANFELIQVKPNWHNSMDVVGYLSNIPAPHYVFTPFIEFVAKAWQNPDIPFFLCLDEMNLAPVEEYFAEFLSAIESRSFENDEYETDPIIKPFVEFGDDVCKQMLDHLLGKVDASRVIANSLEAKLVDRFINKGLTLPKNLLVLGTVNMDETTFSFSRKVLDRAMSIEMNEVDYDMLLKDITDEGLKTIVKDFEEEKYGKGITLNGLLVNRHIEAKEVTSSMQQDAQFVIKYLTRINKLLDGTPFKLGYRAANEAIIYVKAAEEFGCGDVKTALDHFTIMKILSRLEGDESKLTVLENEKRLTNANLNVEKVKEDGKITLLTCLREIIKQELGIYTTKNAISTESADNIDERAETQESDNTPQDEDSENNDTSVQAIEETESNAMVSTNAVNSINENSLKSVAKLDSMIIQLRRDHFVSYWN